MVHRGGGSKLTASAPARPRRLRFLPGDDSRQTHYLFRYPAKFHPPVVRALLQEFTDDNGLVLDPFCGSGTLLVESALLGRDAVGCDVDPVAVFVSSVKTTPLAGTALRRTLSKLTEAIDDLERDAKTYERFKFADLGPRQYGRATADLAIPAIPNLFHWFRRYVIVDLALLREAIRNCDAPATHRRFFELVFASIIRAASNADPVPVSGLEVTAHMKRIDEKGRVVNPFALFRRAANRAIVDMGSYKDAIVGAPKIHARRADATVLRLGKLRPSAVITSPPYHGAVDYYRRHQLEMFWLDLTISQAERIALLQDYIGRPHLSARHPFVDQKLLPPQAASRERRIRSVDPGRADAFTHYCVSMRKTFERLAVTLAPGAPAVFVVGHSSWNGDQLNTSSLFRELAAPHFNLAQHLWYPVRNRYMSYSRHNDASIDREYVLALERTADG